MGNDKAKGQGAQAAAGVETTTTWEQLEPIVRPKPGTVHMGVMKIDKETCTKCGLCLLNCPFMAWEWGEDGFPKFKASYECLSCYNCMVACPVDAVSIVDSYHVDSGFFKTDPHPLPARLPAQAFSADSKAVEWNAFERLVFERRSVRNFKEDPVPEPLIRRVLEAGRFAPSACNCQPWKFIVVTDQDLIEEMNVKLTGLLSALFTMYTEDARVKELLPIWTMDPQHTGVFDPRTVLGGLGTHHRGLSPVFRNAPVVIILAADDRAVRRPDINIGTCGQNMNIVAMSLGLGFCWVGLSQLIEKIPPLKEKLGIEPPWRVCSSVVLGYPKFKQHGIVPREFRPITWLHQGATGPVIED